MTFVLEANKLSTASKYTPLLLTLMLIKSQKLHFSDQKQRRKKKKQTIKRKQSLDFRRANQTVANLRKKKADESSRTGPEKRLWRAVKNRLARDRKEETFRGNRERESKLERQLSDPSLETASPGNVTLTACANFAVYRDWRHIYTWAAFGAGHLF